jgi:hypothetical protein
LYINDLIIDEHVADKVEERKGDISMYISAFEDMKTYPLDDKRLNRLINGYNNGSVIPPITVTKKGCNWKVDNGRHRIAAHILLGRDRINVRSSEPLNSLNTTILKNQKFQFSVLGRMEVEAGERITFKQNIGKLSNIKDVFFWKSYYSNIVISIFRCVHC